MPLFIKKQSTQKVALQCSVSLQNTTNVFYGITKMLRIRFTQPPPCAILLIALQSAVTVAAIKDQTAPLECKDHIGQFVKF